MSPLGFFGLLGAVTASSMRMSVTLAEHGGFGRAQAAVRWRDFGLTFASAAAILSSGTPIMILPLLWWVYRHRPAWVRLGGLAHGRAGHTAMVMGWGA